MRKKRPGPTRKKIAKKKRQLAPKNTADVSLRTREDLEFFQKILSFLKEKTEIDVSQYKSSTIGRRIQRQMSVNKVNSLEKYYERLKTNPDLIKNLLDDIFIHVTGFFRDPESFEALKKNILPRLLNKRRSSAPLRVWVPGCSTGEEVYSIAITLLEFASETKEDLQFQIFATDISEAAIERARAGMYQAEDLGGLSEERVETYFERFKDAYRIRKSIRECCIFSAHDLTRNPPFARIDLVSCRNVLIYFDAHLQKHVVPIFHYSLNPTGYLWLGRSEAPNGISKFFSLLDKTHKFFSKLNTATSVSFRFPLMRPNDKIEIAKKLTNQFPGPLDQYKEVERIGFSRYAPAGALINSSSEIIQIKGHTSPFLELPAGQPNYNLLKLVRRELLSGVRMAIEKAMRTNATARREGLAYVDEGVHKKVDVEVIPVNPQSPKEERNYVVFFEELRLKKKVSALKKKSAAERQSLREDSKDAYIAELLQEIDAMREYQQAVVEGYEATQEELTASNEELQSTLEEFQSTNEELETSKEELQVTNEELETVNEELYRRNDELAKSEERFRLLVEGVKDYAIFMLDTEGFITSWNEGARRLKGYEAAEIIGQHFSRFYRPDDIEREHPKHELEIARVTGRYSEEGWRLRKDGTEFWADILITKIEDAQGNHIGFSKVTRDLTDRMRMEEEIRKSRDELEVRVQERTAELEAGEQKIRKSELALKESEGQLRTFANSIPQLAWIANPEGDIFWYNDRWYQYTGTTPEQMEAGAWQDLQDPAYLPQITERWKHSLATGQPFDMEVPLKGADGRFRWFLSRVVAAHDSHGKVLRWFGTNTDIEEQRSAREQLSRALRVRDEFLSIASHELKTPLTSLKLQLQFMERKTDIERNAVPSPQELLRSLKVALRQIDSMTDLVETLLDISRIETGRFNLTPSEFDLSDLTQQTIANHFAPQIKKAEIDVEFLLTPGVTGTWDQFRLEQVITNLISNAIKYAPQSRLKIETHKQGEFAVLIVQDTGPGISAERLPKIFKRFERAGASRSVGGLGLGLFIVQKIVEAHEGKIQVESAIDQGTKFRVQIPLKPDPAIFQPPIDEHGGS